MARILGAPESVPAGKQATQHVELASVGAQLSATIGDDMLHVRVFLDHHLLVDADGAVAADPAQVVAPEVEQHHVLGTLFLVGEQLRASASSSAASAPRAAGARERPR